MDTLNLSGEELLLQYHRVPNEENRNKAVEAFLYIASVVARRFSKRGLEYDDLYQIAAMALIKLVEKYDPEKNVKFSTYATTSVIGIVKNYFRDHVRSVNLPRQSTVLLQTIEKARAELEQELLRSPTIPELAAKTRLGEDEIIELLEMRNASYSVSLNSVLEDDANAESSESSLEDFLGREDGALNDFEQKSLVESSLARLDDFEQRVLKMRFFEEMTQRQVAEKLQVSQMRISRAERKALKKMREIISEND